jgi:hypothetical protein
MMRRRLAWAVSMVVAASLSSVLGAGCDDDDKKPGPVDGGGTDAPVNGDVVNHDVPVNTDVPVNPGDTGSTDTSGPLPAATSKVIGPAGGQIVFHNGRLTVTFPRGSLTRPTEVEVSALATPPVGALGTVYVVQPAQEALAVGAAAPRAA